MAEVFGFLREDATHGEKIVYDRLKTNLPKEFEVYVEVKLYKRREIRYPDFIILTNYGVIVLEVKDWVHVDHADPEGGIIRTRNNELRRERNPVDIAREYAIILSTELNKKIMDNEAGEVIPWSYAAILPNITPVGITQLRRPWGQEFVLGRADIDNPDLLLSRIKSVFPVRRMRPLTKMELDLVRGIVWPLANVEVDGRPPIVLDGQQIRIVSEPVRLESLETPQKIRGKERNTIQSHLFTEIAEPLPESEEILTKEGEKISRNTSVRLVRGFSGSGKTLVLVQRAKFLAAQYPEWKIAVITYNAPLQKHLASVFKGSSIKPMTFHSLCRKKVAVSDDTCINLGQWLSEQSNNFPILNEFTKDFIENEINWLRDMGISSLDSYLTQQRRGIGRETRLNADQRHSIFLKLEAYRACLKTRNCWDWQELPLLFLDQLIKGVNPSELYDAILVDEAQDWAPVWFKAINLLLKPEGFLFLADDPSQSIYRFFSWKEKGINVIGHTRWLSFYLV